MNEHLFAGFGDAGWDHAPWDQEPFFSADEIAILLDPELSIAEAAERVGCVQRDVERMRHTA